MRVLAEIVAMTQEDGTLAPVEPGNLVRIELPPKFAAVDEVVDIIFRVRVTATLGA